MAEPEYHRYSHGMEDSGLTEVQLQQLLKAFPHGRHRFSGFVTGVFLTLLALAFAGWLAYDWLQQQWRRQKLQNAATVCNELDASSLKRIVGEENLPSWVRFPDYERVGWCNDLLSQLWPHVGAAAGKIVREEAEPKLAEAKPSWMSEISLATFTLGDVPPRVNSIKVYRRESTQEEMIAELEVMWAGKQKFQLLIKPMPKLPLPWGLGKVIANFLSLSVGVQDLYLSGRVRLSCRPLLGRVPIVGAIKVSLVEQPQLAYGLMLQGGDISFLPGLELWINNFLRDSVLQPYILPEGIQVPLDQSGAHADVPKGILYVRLIEAENVPRTDLFTGCDPYVVIFVRGRRKRRSQVQFHTRQPRWEEDFSMLVHDPDVQELNVVLKDHNNWGNDEEIGRLSLPIRDLPPGETKDMWLELGPPKATSLSRISRNPLQAGMQGLRTVEHVVDRRVVSPLLGAPRLGPCRIHVEAAYYRVGAQEVSAASRDAGLSVGGDQRDGADGEIQPAEGAGVDGAREARVMNMLRGGVLSVKINKGMNGGQQGDDNGSGPSRAAQVRVRVGRQEKSTSEAQGKENPDWEETLEFALPGDVADSRDEQIQVEVWDYHWVNSGLSLTWGSRGGRWESFPHESHVDVPLHQVVQQRKLADVWDLKVTSRACVEMELTWMPILEMA